MLRAFTFCRSTAAAADNIGPGGHMSKYATGPHGREWWWSSCRRRPLHWTGSEWVTDLPHDAYSESRICTFMWVSRPTDQAVRWWRHGACLLFKSASDIDDDETVFYANRIQLGKDVKCPIAPPESLTDPFSLTTNSSGINKFSRDNCCCPVQSRFLFLKVSAFFVLSNSWRYFGMWLCCARFNRMKYRQWTGGNGTGITISHLHVHPVSDGSFFPQIGDTWSCCWTETKLIECLSVSCRREECP